MAVRCLLLLLCRMYYCWWCECVCVCSSLNFISFLLFGHQGNEIDVSLSHTKRHRRKINENESKFGNHHRHTYTRMCVAVDRCWTKCNKHWAHMPERTAQQNKSETNRIGIVFPFVFFIHSAGVFGWCWDYTTLPLLYRFYWFDKLLFYGLQVYYYYGTYTVVIRTTLLRSKRQTYTHSHGTYSLSHADTTDFYYWKSFMDWYL